MSELTMTVQPGMEFRVRGALPDERVRIGDRSYRKGDPVPFSPGQEAPLELVELVSSGAAAQPEADTDLSSLTVQALKALALERGVALPEGAKKAEIVAALDAATPTA